MYLYVCMCVCHKTRQCKMLSAVEDMRTTIYNSPLSLNRHTVLPRGVGACLLCASLLSCLSACNRVRNLRVDGDRECGRQGRKGTSCE